MRKSLTLTGVEKDLKVWDMHKAACIKGLTGHKDIIQCLTHTQSGLLVNWASNGVKSIKESHVVSRLTMTIWLGSLHGGGDRSVVKESHFLAMIDAVKQAHRVKYYAIVRLGFVCAANVELGA